MGKGMRVRMVHMWVWGFAWEGSGVWRAFVFWVPWHLVGVDLRDTKFT